MPAEPAHANNNSSSANVMKSVTKDNKFIIFISAIGCLVIISAFIVGYILFLQYSNSSKSASNDSPLAPEYTNNTDSANGHFSINYLSKWNINTGVIYSPAYMAQFYDGLDPNNSTASFTVITYPHDSLHATAYTTAGVNTLRLILPKDLRPDQILNLQPYKGSNTYFLTPANFKFVIEESNFSFKNSAGDTIDARLIAFTNRINNYFLLEQYPDKSKSVYFPIMDHIETSFKVI